MKHSAVKFIITRVVAVIVFAGIACAARYTYQKYCVNVPKVSETTETINLSTLSYPSQFVVEDEPVDVPSEIYVEESESVISVSIPDEAELVEVVWVSDGDTYIVNWHDEEVTIRLIGVDTPESVASEEYLDKSGKQNTEEGKIASNIMKEKLQKGTHIYVLPGQEPTDLYGRSLVYAWFDDGCMIEDFLLINGYADIMEIPPNTAYSQHFREVKSES